MIHYIDKDALVAEIEKLRAKWFGINNDFADGQKGALTDVLSLIDTLVVKEVDLDNFIKEEFDKYSCVDGYGQLSVSYNEAEFYSMIKRLIKVQKGEEV